MVQRIQTIYLLLAIICLGLTFAFPFATYLVDGNEIVFNAYGVEANDKGVATFFPYYISVALAMGLAVFSLLQYKKRKLQLKVGRFNYLLIILTIVLIFIEASIVEGKFELDQNHIAYGIGIYFPVAALPFIFLANRGIKKDEALVKSLDRLR